MNDLPKRKRRWYQFTPERFIVGLLAVEGLLLLSERLRWFAFSEKRRFTVLVAVAAVCLGVLFLLLWYAVSLLLRRRFQFGVRSLLVLVLVVAIAGSWLAVTRQQVRRQREAVKAIEKAGGLVEYEEPETPVPPRLIVLSPRGYDSFVQSLRSDAPGPTVGRSSLAGRWGIESRSGRCKASLATTPGLIQPG